MPVQSWVSKGGMTVPVKTSVTEAASRQIGDKHTKAGSGGRWGRGTVEEKGEAPFKGLVFLLFESQQLGLHLAAGKPCR